MSVKSWVGYLFTTREKKGGESRADRMASPNGARQKKK